ncbi:polysaccharide biosynthesis/export family protein [Belliella marina]|uniref:Polysaccharide biosynthesis/export family protein n=1 Tax=Belliella marina TaxID=1644146 RepID=A0ABW4VR29_9BACT
MKGLFYICLVTISLYSCSPRNLTYFSNLDPTSETLSEIPSNSNVRIQKNDRLKIVVSSPSMESNVLFNGGVLPNQDELNGVNNNIQQITTNSYLVNSNGKIEFPVIGEIQVAGLTIEEIRNELKFLLRAHVKEPSVNVYLSNFRITVIGEVSNPSHFIVENDKINILEALGMAGDMTAFGKRENVLLMREIDGQRATYRINLNDKEILRSPQFNLIQNDIIYVEPDKAKEKQTRDNRTLITVASIGSSILVALIFNYQNLFN